MERWVKLYDKFTDWEWFDNSQMVHIFIYLFLRANVVTEKYHGMEIARGQLVTTLSKISADTHISTQTVRTCLKRLLSTGEITKSSTNQRTVITIVNYDRYQQPSAPKPAEVPPPIAATPVSSSEEAYKQEMLTDAYWIEVMCMRHHIHPKEKLTDYINRFWLDAVCRGKSHDDIRDAKQHFNSWLLIVIKNEQNQTTNGTTTSQRRGTEVSATSAEDYKTSF